MSRNLARAAASTVSHDDEQFIETFDSDSFNMMKESFYDRVVEHGISSVTEENIEEYLKDTFSHHFQNLVEVYESHVRQDRMFDDQPDLKNWVLEFIEEDSQIVQKIKTALEKNFKRVAPVLPQSEKSIEESCREFGQQVRSLTEVYRNNGQTQEEFNTALDQLRNNIFSQEHLMQMQSVLQLDLVEQENIDNQSEAILAIRADVRSAIPNYNVNELAFNQSPEVKEQFINLLFRSTDVFANRTLVVAQAVQPQAAIPLPRRSAREVGDEEVARINDNLRFRREPKRFSLPTEYYVEESLIFVNEELKFCESLLGKVERGECRLPFSNDDGSLPSDVTRDEKRFLAIGKGFDVMLRNAFYRNNQQDLSGKIMFAWGAFAASDDDFSKVFNGSRNDIKDFLPKVFLGYTRKSEVNPAEDLRLQEPRVRDEINSFITKPVIDVFTRYRAVTDAWGLAAERVVDAMDISRPASATQTRDEVSPVASAADRSRGF